MQHAWSPEGAAYLLNVYACRGATWVLWSYLPTLQIKQCPRAPQTVQTFLFPRMNCLGLLWPQDLTVISSLDRYFPKIQFVEKQNSLCRERLDFETTIIFLSLAELLSLKWIIVISNQCLHSNITISMTTNEDLHSSFPLLLVSDFILLTVQYWLGHYLRKVSHRICSSSL